MSKAIHIGIIGDFDGRPSHLATNDAIKHSAAALGFNPEIHWLGTDTLEVDEEDELKKYDGFWCAPGAPYKSITGAFRAIRFARENDYPFIGTCAGFQHTTLEFAKNVLKKKELQAGEFDPYSQNKFITELSCSLLGQVRHILISKSSMLYDVYGTDQVEERYNCSFGLSPEFQKELVRNGLEVIGKDEQGEARIMVISKNRFFLITLFQPQLSSTAEKPHPLILSYLSAVKEFNSGRLTKTNCLKGF